MNNVYVKYIIRLALLTFAQVFIINNMNFTFYVSPQIYLLTLLLLPVKLPKMLALMLAFVAGISIDFFSNTYGLHTSAALVFMLLRLIFASNFAEFADLEPGQEPHMRIVGIRQFILFNGLLIFAHHFWFFSLAIFKISAILLILLKTFSSAVASLFLIYFIELGFAKKYKK